ncbi:hypothetical protein ACJX0J_028409, partial [Zea mays]
LSAVTASKRRITKQAIACIYVRFECLTMLHTPLTTNLFLGLNQLDYTLNVFCVFKCVSAYFATLLGAIATLDMFSATQTQTLPFYLDGGKEALDYWRKYTTVHKHLSHKTHNHV